MKAIFGPCLLVLLLPVLVSAPARADDVDVALDTFGVGSHFRPGEFAGIRLILTSNLPEPTPVWVQCEIPNADGDIAEYGRSLTLTPNRDARVWLYVPLPPDPNPSWAWWVRVFEERDGQRLGDLGGRPISPPSGGALGAVGSVGMEQSLIAVVGQTDMGLDGFTAPQLGTGSSVSARPPASHENTLIVQGLAAGDLPDRWEGLRGFEAVAWGWGLTMKPVPQDLSTDQSHALLEYVRRGGHLIISLPATGNPWQLGSRGRLEPELERVLPTKAPRKDEAVPLETLLPILSKQDAALANPAVTIRVFKDLAGGFDAIDNEYAPLVALPDGRVVVIRRTHGFGWITIIGIDLSSGTLLSTGVPQADAFWNRILGRRHDTPSGVELTALGNADRLARRDPEPLTVGRGALFTDQINMSGSASIGVLLALLLFGTYWVVAGPGSFGLLKRTGRTKHAWLVFAGVVVAFTAVAWGTMGLLRQRAPSVKHVTFLDYLARPGGDRGDEDPQLYRAASFFSIYLPSYGRTEVAIDSLFEERNLLVNWTPPPLQPQPFPNIDRYGVDVGDSPARYEIPSRATATQMYAHWLGVPPRDWGGMLYVDPENPIEVRMQGDREAGLRGVIKHDLPGTLTNVLIVWVQDRRPAPRRYERGEEALPVVNWTDRGKMLNTGHAWEVSYMQPGAALDLGGLQPGGDTVLSSNIQERYIDPYDEGGGMLRRTSDAGTRRDFMEMLSFYHQLTPPEYFVQRKDDPTPPSIAAERMLGRELDLSPWLGRPCLIIIGYLEDSSLPIPFTIDGESPRTEGGSLTVVRWIYPLPVSERIAFGTMMEASESEPDRSADRL